MATPALVGYILRTSLWSVLGGQAAVNTLHYHVDTIGASPATDQDIVDTLDTAIFAAYKALLCNNATYKGVQGQFIWPLPISIDVAQTGHAGAGTAGAGPAPLQTSGLISWYTNTAGRHGRGRTYIPFPYTADNDSSGVPHPTAGYVTRLETFAVAVQSLHSIAVGPRTATVSMCLFDAKPPGQGDFRYVVSHTSRDQWATQRRRSAYGRPNSSPI